MALRGRSTARPPAGRELARKNAARIPPISEWPKWPRLKKSCDHCHDANHPAEYPHDDERWCGECIAAEAEA